MELVGLWGFVRERCEYLPTHRPHLIQVKLGNWPALGLFEILNILSACLQSFTGKKSDEFLSHSEN